MSSKGIKKTGYFFLFLSIGYLIYDFLAYGDPDKILNKIVSLLFLFIGFGFLNHSLIAQTEDDIKEFNMWLNKMVIEVSFEGLYVGLLVTIAANLITVTNTSNYDEQIKELENRIEIIEQTNEIVHSRKY